jgi:hypothetical protein
MTAGNNDASAGFTVMKGDARIVSFCCDVALYTGEDLSSIPGAVLHIYDRFLAICPPERLRWYATDNMTRHNPVTPRALEMLRGWLKPGAPTRRVISIDLKDSQGVDEAPEYSFWVRGKEPGDLGHGVKANNIRCTFPGSWGAEKPDALFEFAADACANFPYLWGHAGFVLETSPYYQGDGHVAAWRLSMQHPGLDLSNPITDATRVRRKGIKGVNWLTMLGPEFVDRLGSVAALRSQLPTSVAIIPAGNGIIIRAGDVPRWGHVNRQDLLPEYRAVYKAVAPLQDPIVQPYTSFSLPGNDYKEKTTAWLRRFADVS